jgi:hypothetical protein
MSPEEWEAVERSVEEVTTEELEATLVEGQAHPLGEDETRRLLTKCLETLRASAQERGDLETLARLVDPIDVMVGRIMESRRRQQEEP